MTNFDKLVSKLSELFELEKSDLDFGIHRIIKARQKHIRIFLGLEPPSKEDQNAPTLEKIVQREMGELNTVEAKRQLDAITAKIKTDYGKLAFDDSGKLASGLAKDSEDGQQWLTFQEQLDSGSVLANIQLEAEIYSLLTEFFSRYYDEADFLSKRRIKAGDAPYAVPYSGEEVMLHWANKDQYYIKSSKDLKDYTFTLPEQFGNKRVQFKCERQDPVLNNNNAKREFYLDDEAKIQVGDSHLVIPFHFKIVDKTRTQPETKKWIENIVARLPLGWQQCLTHKPDGAVNNIITRHLNNYTRKNESDFFIHKHLGKFLRGELDFYIKNEVMHLDDIDTKSTDYLATRVRLIKALRTIARYIITFLAQLENFQKKLWLKKKYVTETQYCITLDRLFAAENGETLIAAVLKHCETKIRRYDGGMRSQHDEWVKLYRIDELEDYPQNSPLTEAFLRAHDKMMLDTVFFSDSFKWQLLGGIDDLDASLDGLIIHSENFQALNLLQERYREKVKCVYIDPPYNTGEDGFPYKDSYATSSWLSMFLDRVSISRSLLNTYGLFACHMDEHEHMSLEWLVKQVFGKSGDLGKLIWDKRNPKGDSKGIGAQHEYVHFATNTADHLKEIIDAFSRNKENAETILEKAKQLVVKNRGVNDRTRKEFKEWIEAQDFSGGEKAYCMIDDKGDVYRPVSMSWPNKKKAPNEYFIPLIHPITEKPCPVPARGWRNPPDTMKTLLSQNLILFGQDENTIPNRKYLLKENLTETVASLYYMGSSDDALFADLNISFENPKPIKAAKYFLSIIARPHNSLSLDYFAGSGTTAHAVINLNREDGGKRKYILVEMGDHFDTVLKPRIQKVVYSKEWKDGKPKSMVSDAEGKSSSFIPHPSTFSGISHAFKYLRLESYEDALNNLDLGEDRAPDLLGLGDQVREDYLFSYLLDVETRGHLLNLDRFRDPWGCQLKIHDPHTGKSEPRVIDLVETFNYLIGVTVREVKCREGFLTIEGESPTGDTILILWRKIEGESEWLTTTNEALKTFVHQTLRLNPADTEYHAIYINGDHTLEDPHSKIHCIEEVFYDRMFDGVGTPED